MKRWKYIVIDTFIFIFVRPIAYVLFDPKYISGVYFETFHSCGWRWVLKAIIKQKILGKNRKASWPISGDITIVSPHNIEFDKNDLNNFQGFGNYFQAMGKIKIGKGTWIAPNVGLITSNHDINNLNEHADAKSIILGEDCWIGMNSVILPGVHLGEKTIVGAGAVVTKSFENGRCIVAGNPAKIIKKLE